MPDNASNNKKKKKIFSIISSVVTAAIIGFFSMLAFLPFYSPNISGSSKYGPYPTPFDNRLMKYLKIRGRVISKSNNMPVDNLKVKLNEQSLETVTNKNGAFTFELFNVNETDFKIEIPGIIPLIGTKTYEVKFDRSPKAPQKNNYIDVQETTIEILL